MKICGLTKFASILNFSKFFVFNNNNKLFVIDRSSWFSFCFCRQVNKLKSKKSSTSVQADNRVLKISRRLVKFGKRGKEIVSSRRPGRRKAGSNKDGTCVVAKTTKPRFERTLSMMTNRSVIISNFTDKFIIASSASNATLTRTE